MSKDFIKLSKKWFDNQAEEYDQKDTVVYSKYGKISCKNIAGYLEDYEYENLLDIGCGTGYLIDMLSKKHKAEYTGLDLSPKMIKVAIEKNIDSTSFVEGVSDNLPFDDNTFDVVTCSQSFHHYPDTDKSLKEAYRVLKPNGIYIISDTGVGPFKNIGVAIDNFIYRNFSSTGDCNISYLEKMREDMMRNNFKIIKTEKLSKLIYTIVGKK